MAERWVRIADLAGDPDAAELLATALTDLAVARSLVLMHGERHGLRRYIEAGGRVRFDDQGEPVIARATR
jgi:hypothetical protein